MVAAAERPTDTQRGRVRILALTTLLLFTAGLVPVSTASAQQEPAPEPPKTFTSPAAGDEPKPTWDPPEESWEPPAEHPEVDDEDMF